MQRFQRSLVMRLCCATSLANSARASATLTSDSQVILQTGLDHVGRRTVTLSDGQQLVVEQVQRRGTTVITVSLPEVYIILCENIEQFLISDYNYQTFVLSRYWPLGDPSQCHLYASMWF